MIILKNVSPTTAVTSVPVCGAVFVFKPFGCNFDFFVFSPRTAVPIVQVRGGNLAFKPFSCEKSIPAALERLGKLL
jgi:hypothetical protein